MAAAFSAMCKTQAKDVTELRTLLLELDEKKKAFEEIVGSPPQDLHAKSVLAGMLDAETRRHTINDQGAGVTFEELR